MQGLPYKRQNRMVKILKKQKIGNQVEYDFVTDTMVGYLQDGLLTEAEVSLLNTYLNAFENKADKTKV